jgi:hypothetical protein
MQTYALSAEINVVRNKRVIRKGGRDDAYGRDTFDTCWDYIAIRARRFSLGKSSDMGCGKEKT